jgi:hypothetical protein
MWMTINEQEFFKKHLNGSQKVLEWGCGSSTINISSIVNEIYSVEHDSEWFNKISKEVPSNVHLFLCKPDLPYNEGGHCGTFDEFKTYIEKPIGLGIFDLILIDGRARIECSKICHKISHDETLIFVHDYRGRYKNENYEEIENYLTLISETENLSLFKIKK